MNFVVLFLCVLLSAPADDAAEGFATARVVIEQQEASVRSFDVEYSIAIELRDLGAAATIKPMLQQQSFHEQRRGDRYRRHFDLVVNAHASKEVQHDLQAFDGGIYQWFAESEKAGGFSSKGAEPTCVTQTIYFSSGGLDDLLSQHREDAETQWEMIAGEKLLVVRWEENDGLTRRAYYLNPTAAFQPRRYTLESEYPEGSFPDGRKGSKYVGEVLEYLRQDAVVWPKVVRLVRVEVDAHGREFRTFDKLTRIESLRINPELDDAVFKIDFPHGTTVTDKDRGVVFIAGKRGSEQPLSGATMPAMPAVTADGLAYELWADWRVWVAASGICAGLLFWLKGKETRKDG